MRYRSRCLLSAGIHSALFALLWSSAMVLCAEKKIPIAPPPEMTEGDVPWLMEAVFEPNRLHVSQASLEKFQKYRKLTCRDGGSNAHRLDQEEYLHQYLEWEQVEFNRALRDTIMKNEKNLNSPEGFEVLKTASETMLDTHFTSKCLPTGESIAGQQQKMTTEIRERTLFEDVLINKVMPFLDWGDDEDLVSYVLEVPEEQKFASVGTLATKAAATTTTTTTTATSATPASSTSSSTTTSSTSSPPRLNTTSPLFSSTVAPPQV